MADMFEVLDILVADDPDTSGDFWRGQPWIKLPLASHVRPNSYADLGGGSLKGKRFGVPAMYINADIHAGTGKGCGIGGPTGQKLKRAHRSSTFGWSRVARLRTPAQRLLL
jgi:amidase